MTHLHIRNIGLLGGLNPDGVVQRRGDDMRLLPSVEHVWLQVEGDHIRQWGQMEEEPPLTHGVEVWDAEGAWAMPAFVDPHTHLVHSGTREQEWIARSKGATYQEIAASGGGIMHSVRMLRAADYGALLDESRGRLETIRAMGVGSVEIKSGYGLDFAAEGKIMRVIRALAAEYPEMNLFSTCLALHAVAPEFEGNASAYVERVTGDWIPRWAGEGLIDFVDIFCEQGYFGLRDLDSLMTCAQKLGLKVRAHVNQFSVMGAVGRAVDGGALTVDHLEELAEEDLAALQSGATYPVLLPGCSFFLGIPYAPARRLIEAGLPVVVGSDYNPGSSPGLNPFFTLCLACQKLGMSPTEALNAMTLNAAASLEISDRAGCIEPGKEASLLFIYGINDWATLPYHFGQIPPLRVMLKGRFV